MNDPVTQLVRAYIDSMKEHKRHPDDDILLGKVQGVINAAQAILNLELYEAFLKRTGPGSKDETVILIRDDL